MPALVPGRCNWCGGPLSRGQLKVCSPACRTAWRNFLGSIGPSIAERLIYERAHRHRRPMPEPAKRAYREMMEIGRRALGRLRDMHKELTR
ncbi:hypothetical protein N0B44_15770 [Roseibacterium beibuensis]|uniref:hypothetical protein n=1 Tax=[Roseibacterium] beibuensis TaxID=1193142 RepID=UPI00217CEF67|nr:hypothetical protein [Roseibacterium beibuensis]MCS6624377.1 hypothetical protein [Roseibacterium beibuensis]